VSFRITGLSPEPYRHLFGLSSDELHSRSVVRYVVDEKPGFPDRIEMRDAAIGESVLLVNHTHQPADNPYRASHAIFVREGACVAYDRVDEVPEVMLVRTMSLRAFDASDMMTEADLVDGTRVGEAIERLFSEARVAYVQAHYAKRGCFAARITRT
jgi:hypothetical protein